MNIKAILAAHRELDESIEESGQRPFLSDWNGTHPFVRDFFPPREGASSAPLDHGKYFFFDHAKDLSESIRRMHRNFDGLELSEAQIIAGEGATSFIAAFTLWLIDKRIREVFYLPPLYHTFHYLFRLLGIHARQVSGRHAFEPRATMNLPSRRSTLLFCDPIWYAGRRLDAQVIDHIAQWQESTGSVIFVDGSFQYMQWDGDRRERTATLNPALTFRLICPTKCLGVHASRFSYLLHPVEQHQDFLFLYENLMGATSSSNINFARRAMEAMNTESSNRRFTEHLRDIYGALSQQRRIETTIAPDCGYFVFVKLLGSLAHGLVMGQGYFDQKRYPDYARLNLLQANKFVDSPE